ncbi:transglycosylase SLT domain-containing protein [Novosphingobium resinovorum]|nr:transglycosylase SLT domain-containing protein [Novosphingobium resinovorum]
MSPRRSSSRRRTVALAWLACFAGVPAAILTAPAQAQTAPSSDANAIARHVADAAQRWAIPEAWIWAVMGVESAGDPGAVSAKGAIGLMQIMPATWAALRVRHALGVDPYDVRANIMAGAAYLRAMLDRYGDPAAMLAAYNAGPGRYDEYLRGRPLPAETRAYVARLAPAIGAAPPSQAHPVAAPDPPAWTRSALFAARDGMLSDRATVAVQPVDDAQQKGAPEGRSAVALVAATSPSPGLFVPLSGRSSQ